MKIIILVFLFIINIIAEENISLERKKDNPVFIKVKKNKLGYRNSLSFVEVEEDKETLGSLSGLSTIKLKFNSGDYILKVKEYNIDKKLLFSDKILKTKNGFLLHSFKGKNKKGKAIFQRIIYDTSANPITIEFIDELNKPTIDKDGISKIILSYNKFGKKTSESFFDLLDKPREDKFGVAKYEYIFDSLGNLLTSKTFSDKNSLTENKYGIAVESNTYDYTSDINGKLVLKEFFNKENKPKKDKFGIAKYISTFNKDGLKISQISKNENDELVEDSMGFAKRIWGFDESKNLILEEEYGKDGKLKNDPSDNVARIINEFLKSENSETKISTFYDSNGKLVLNETFGVAQIKSTKTKMKNGYEILEEYFDTEKKPMNSIEGYHFLLKHFDNLDNQVYEEYRDVSERLVASKDGYAKYKASFNSKNLLTEEYFSVDNKLVEGDEGYAKQVREYDSENNLIKIENFDSGNNLTMSELGFAIQKIFFNKLGQKIKEEFYDPKKNLVNNYDGFARINFSYDSNCLNFKKQADCVSKLEYLNKDLKPINPKKRFHKEENSYDKKGNLLSKKTFNAENELLILKEFMYLNEFQKETAIEHYKNKNLNKALYFLYLINPFNKTKVLKITLNKFLRPVKLEEEGFED